VTAKGGLEKLRSIKTMRAESTTYVDGPDGRVAVKTRSYIEYPDKFRVDAESPGGRVSQVFAGNTFWIQDARGTRMAPEPIAAEMRSSIERDTVKLLLRLVESPTKAKRTKATIDGREMPAIEIAGTSGTPVTLIFDPATWLIAGQRYTLESPSGPLSAEETFSDYRDVNGLKVAFKAIARRQGAPRVERVLERVEYNVPLDPALFAKPS
jgi:outer membrane lipoprotein-sorting protein